MKWLNSVIIAFANYSRIPMPKADWDADNRKYAMCFFPLVGLAIGAIYFLCWLAMSAMNFGPFLRGAVLTAVPIFVTGGFHLDGFCDVIDALSSYQPKEKKLEILSDSRSGAFAVIYSGIYLLLYAGLSSEIGSYKTALIIGLSFGATRAVTGLLSARMPRAKKTGTLAPVEDRSQKRTITVWMSVYLAVIFACACIINIYSAALGLIFGALAALYCKRRAEREFGGITGDVAGWFNQICEIGLLLAAALGERAANIL